MLAWRNLRPTARRRVALAEAAAAAAPLPKRPSAIPATFACRSRNAHACAAAAATATGAAAPARAHVQAQAHVQFQPSEPVRTQLYEHTRVRLPAEVPDAVRLVELLPGKEADELVVQLHQTTLRDAPPYETLSYEWGRPDDKQPISFACGVHKLLVPTNLILALRRLRLPDRARLMWIDAICIDQEDVAERNRQVGIMTQIYRQAESVVIWLREETTAPEPETRRAFKLIPKLARIWNRREPSDDPTLEHHFLSGDKAVPEMKVPEIEKAVFDVFTRSYFTRTWIIQEIIMAKNAKVACGGHEVSWTQFHQAANYLVQREFRLDRQCPPSTLFLVALIRKTQKRFHENLLDLRMLLRHFRHSQATDQRDKVYAMLGIAFPPPQFSPHHHPNLNPNPSPNPNPRLHPHTLQLEERTSLRIPPPIANYRKSVQQVYSETAAFLISQDQNLKLLANEFLPNSGIIPGLPSWVPDWSITSGRIIPMRARRSDALGALVKGTISFSSDCASLFVTAHLFDPVAYVSPVVTASNESLILAEVTAKIDACSTIACSHAYLTGESRQEALRRTLIANKTTFRPKLSVDERYFYHLLSDQMDTDMVPIIPKGLEQDLRYRTVKYNVENNGVYVRELRRTLYDRNFFVTKGGYMGLGPKGGGGVSTGDWVAVLAGGVSPFVIRPGKEVYGNGEGDFWTLVGESYVHGIMEGEWRGSENSATKTIEIK